MTTRLLPRCEHQRVTDTLLLLHSAGQYVEPDEAKGVVVPLWGKCIQVQSKFVRPLQNTQGHLHVALEFLDTADEITISHVIAL